MRSCINHAVRVVIVWHIITFLARIKCKLKHLHSRVAGRSQEIPDAVRQKTEIFGNDLLLAEHFIDLVKKKNSRAFLPGTVYCCFFAVWNSVIFIKAAEMVDSHHVIPFKTWRMREIHQ